MADSSAVEVVERELDAMRTLFGEIVQEAYGPEDLYVQHFVTEVCDLRGRMEYWPQGSKRDCRQAH